MNLRNKSMWYGMRAIRKTAHFGNRVLHKTLNLSTRVENKATRILDGTDYSVRINTVDPLEKVYYSAIPLVLPINPALPKVGQDAAVVLLIPSLDGKSFYGGAATALIVAAKISIAMKRPLRIVQTTKTGKPSGLQQFFDREGVSIKAETIDVVTVADRAYNVYGYLAIHPDDVFIASAWWDAHVLFDLPMKHRIVYLIQDFEPIFYNNSDQYALAEATYKRDGFIPICNTHLMYDFMKGRSYPAFQGKDAFSFEPAVSRQASGLRQTKVEGDKKRFFLYGRPNVHRNLFFTALNALDFACKAGFINPSEWEFYMAGDDQLPDIKLTSGATIRNKGKMSMEEYVDFSKSIDVALAPMMAPHPNYPTLEFSSIGAQVVTTRYANKTDLIEYSPNIVMCDIDVESMAGAIKEAVKRANKPEKNTTHSTLPKNWDDSLDKVISNLLKRV